MSHGLSPDTVAAIQSVLARFPTVERAVLYGSRAKGNYRKGSDIDLTLIGAEVDRTIAGDVALELDDLPIPYKVDVSAFARLTHAGLIDHIRRVGLPIYERAAVAAR